MGKKVKKLKKELDRLRFRVIQMGDVVDQLLYDVDELKRLNHEERIKIDTAWDSSVFEERWQHGDMEE